ncbi:MAG: AAA family ATPase [Planctomycetota bacterium]|nr:MAG: AAA family ATPase [Planctomycetota bacterium]
MLWSEARARIEGELGWVRTHTWLDGLRLRRLGRSQAVVEADTKEAHDAAREHTATLEAAVGAVAGRPLRLRLVLSRRARPRRQPAPPVPLEPSAFEGERVGRRYRLCDYFGAAEGALAVRFAQGAVERPGEWHPLVFHGESSSGKTHLLQGLANAVRRRRPTAKVVYTTGQRFARQYVQAMRRRHTRGFRRLHRRADYLLIDEVDDLIGKPATERELCFTFDALQLSGSQVVVAALSAPHRLRCADPALRTRLLGGLVVPLRRAGAATRRAIAEAHCAASGLPLTPAVLDFLCQGVDLDARELLSALRRLEVYRRAGRSLDLPGVRDALRDVLDARLQPASLEGVSDFVAARLGTSVEKLRGRSRKATLVEARQVAMALARELTGLTLREVGDYFGGRSCATVHCAQQTALRLREARSDLQELWSAARSRFVSSVPNDRAST